MQKIKSWVHENEHKLSIGFFVGGFIFDIITLDRIDSWFTIIQQATYLLLLIVILAQMLIEQVALKPLSARWNWYTNWRVPAAHFVFGSLLSSYTLFFFKSSSLGASFIFLFLIASLLVINELPRFQNLGLGFKFALLSLCTMSYFAYLVPVLIGQSGTLIFLASLIAGLAPLLLMYRIFMKRGIDQLALKKQLLRPSLYVFFGFLLSYLMGIIPPVPLSIQYMGIYHAVKKSADGKFELSHLRPWWRFWHNGDQWFAAQPGDKIIAFFRLFSPTNFTDEVRVIWYLDVPGKGWQAQDKIPIKIVGGRDQGFRGYAVKSNYTEGQWRVVVESTDGREIGRLGFSVSAIPAENREFQIESQ